MSTIRRKDAGNANGPTRPLMPRLAASTQNSKASPTPKLAGYNSTPPLKRSTTSQTTPVFSSAKPFPEDKATPVSNFVNANITPRSSSRRSRAGSSQSTPVNELDDTPSKSRPSSTLGLEDVSRKGELHVGERSETDVPRLKTQQTMLQQKHQSLPASPTLTRSPDHVGDGSSTSEKPNYFFYANEGPKQETAPRPAQHKKTGSFVYANGSTNNGVQAHSGKSFATGGSGQPSKSFHARQHSQPQVQSGMNVKAPPISIPAFPRQQRQPSPPRQGFHLTYRKGASQIIPPQPLSPQIPEYDPTRRRKSSVDDDANNCQSRTFRAPSATSRDSQPRVDNGFPFLSMFSLPSSKSSPMISPVADSSLRSSGDRDIIQTLDPEIDRAHSPPSTIGSSNSDQHRVEVAAYARRERKIMDLEISNSSLLVINRSLEKEVRRQKTELRRYKRMSRKTSQEAVRVASGRLSILTKDEDDVGMDDCESIEEESEELESETDSFVDEPMSPMSPGAVIQRDARHRKHDQIRLKKDFTKHRELLADSQRMNQSLKKCMNITESLIKEGNRALEHRVDMDEVQIGGRILSADDLNVDFSYSRSSTPLHTTEAAQEPPGETS